eukprot:GHVR01062205.1.p1 GENE.GHVR01062205.1~~GHVR01062205.1.p1  ORF type:complete len:139 (-),score=39.87 GHVR01062205.1:162-524(-)
MTREQLVDILARASCAYEGVLEQAREVAGASTSARRLMVRNIPYTASTEDLKVLFSKHGELEDAAVVRQRSGQSKGFGFVIYKSIEPVEKVLSMVLELEGRNIVVRLAADSAQPLHTSSM